LRHPRLTVTTMTAQPLPPLAPLAPASGPLSALTMLQLEASGPVLHLRLNRPAKRNSISDDLLAQLHTVFVNLPRECKVVVLSGAGDHFCAGLDLSEVAERTVAEGLVHSRSWHACFDAIQFGPVPVIAVLHGAVVGGGLELAASAHLRVAEASTFYALPEGTRGIFLGGGGSVRIPRLVGAARVTDMMLTGRSIGAADGERLGFAQYLVGEGEGLAKALELAAKVAGNAALSNYAITQALPRIADMAAPEGLFVESLIASIAQGDEAAKERVRAFLAGKAAKVQKA
jgi:enoyl-CoA hydratase/carnithine racemase